MSRKSKGNLFKKAGSPFWWYEFVIDGRRVRGSTKEKSEREAREIAKAAKKEARDQAALVVANAPPDIPRTISEAALRYWNEKGSLHSNAGSTHRDLMRLVEYFGKTKLLTEIRDADVATLVAWRRGHRAMPHNRPDDRAEDSYPFVTPATVNRTTTQVLKKVFNRALNVWGVRFEKMPVWKEHMLKEPDERVRELVGDEGVKLTAETRDDYLPFYAFVTATGLRQEDCVGLRWREVNWEGGQIIRIGKGDKRVVAPITPYLRTLLTPLKGHHPEFVFTYVATRTIFARQAGAQAARTGNGKTKGELYTAERGQEARIKGRRYPLTLSGVKSAWKRIRKNAGVTDFRFHDFRHDVATKLLRKTGNLKMVSKVLNHSSLKTTMKYAHVLDEDVAGVMVDFHKARADAAPLHGLPTIGPHSEGAVVDLSHINQRKVED